MGMYYLPPYTHRCVIQSGSMKGSKYQQDVDAIDVEYQNTCEHCGEPLATPNQIIAYLYDELIKVHT